MLLIRGLSGARKSHDHITRTDVGIVDDIASFHTTSNGGIDDNSPYEVAHIGCFTSRGKNADTHLTEFCQQFVSTVDDGRNHFARHQHLITSDGA